MPVINPRFDFTDATPVSGVGGTHTVERIRANAMSPELYNEYERLFVEIANAIGNYNFTDIISVNAVTLSSGIRELYNKYNADLTALQSSKFNSAGGIIFGNVSIQGALSVTQDFSVAGIYHQLGSSIFSGSSTFENKSTFNQKVSVLSNLEVNGTVVFGSTLAVAGNITAPTITVSGNIQGASFSGNQLSISGLSTIDELTVNGSATFSQPVVFESTVTINTPFSFVREVTFEKPISITDTSVFEKQVTFKSTFVSDVVGSSPFTVASSYKVPNLNADKVDGYEPSTTAAAGAIPLYNESAQLVGDITGSSTSCTGLSNRALIAGSLAYNGDYNHPIVFSWTTETVNAPTALLAVNGDTLYPVLPGILSVALSAGCTGNSVTANKLKTAIRINDVLFDGSSDITIACAASSLTGDTLSTSIMQAPSLTYVGNQSSTFVVGGSLHVSENTKITGELTLKNTLSGVLKSTAGSITTAVPYTDFLPPNPVIQGNTFTKITYDSYGFVIGGSRASTADVDDSTDRRYVTDEQKASLASLAGINTGDQTTISGNAGSATKLQTARKINNVLFDGSSDIEVSSFSAGISVIGDSTIDGTLVLTKNLYSSGEFWTSVSSGEAAMGVAYEFGDGIRSMYMFADATRRGIYDSFSDLNIIERSWASSSWVFSGDITGNAATATKLAAPKTISLTGAVTGSISTDFNSNLSIVTTTSTLAPLESPTFTGTPKAPTATVGDSSEQIANTAFVATAVSNAVQTNLTNHANNTTAHGATSAATASTIIARDADGRAQVATPAADADIANKSYVDSRVVAANGAGDVTSASTSSTDGNFAIMSGTTGKAIEASEYSPSSFMASNAACGRLSWNGSRISIDGSENNAAVSYADNAGSVTSLSGHNISELSNNSRYVTESALSALYAYDVRGLGQTPRNWYGITTAPNGDIYACVHSGDIYKQSGGTGAFVALGQTSRLWFGMTAAPNGDIYASVNSGDIYKQSGGTGDFVALGQTPLNWRGMAAAPNGDIYACASGGDIYKQSGGTGDFVALGQTPQNWRGMAAAPNGDIYACVIGGDIYKQSGGTGAFVALGQTGRNWVCMTAAPNGDIYACVHGSDIYKQSGGTGDFVALRQTTRTWYGISAAPNGDIYACVYNGDIYTFRYTHITPASIFPVTVTGADVTITENRFPTIRFTGALIGNRVVTMPADVRQYKLICDCTGAYYLHVKTASGTGVYVYPGDTVDVYCDGTNIVFAEPAVAVNALSLGGVAAADYALKTSTTSQASGLTDTQSGRKILVKSGTAVSSGHGPVYYEGKFMGMVPGSATVTFTSAFPTQCFGVIAGGKEINSTIGATGVTFTGLSFNGPFEWMAFGY